MWRIKMSHVAHKNEPCGIKNRAIWHLPFLNKYCYNYSHKTDKGEIYHEEKQ